MIRNEYMYTLESGLRVHFPLTEPVGNVYKEQVSGNKYTFDTLVFPYSTLPEKLVTC